MRVKSTVPFNGYVFLNKLAECSDVINVLNGWKEGCGDKSMLHADRLMLCVESFYTPAEDGSTFDGVAELYNGAIYIKDGHTYNTVLRTGEDSCNFRMSDCVDSGYAKYISTNNVRSLESSSEVTLDDYIDEIVRKHESDQIRRSASLASKQIKIGRRQK